MAFNPVAHLGFTLMEAHLGNLYKRMEVVEKHQTGYGFTLIMEALVSLEFLKRIIKFIGQVFEEARPCRVIIHVLTD